MLPLAPHRALRVDRRGLEVDVNSVITFSTTAPRAK
jgi:hypothetical protein